MSGRGAEGSQRRWELAFLLGGRVRPPGDGTEGVSPFPQTHTHTRAYQPWPQPTCLPTRLSAP